MRFLEFTFQSFWHFVGVFLIIEIIAKLILFLWGIFWKHLTIRRHGYPPAHCDADGDFKEEEDEE